ncbi:DUF3971 domain-containing protein [Tardiphaga sp.]|jgi:hypothetical protein|uniref:YhdP family protein n=1 Tax=Tardiphaga sp. TaxID=1926292 RepID=UPI0037DA4049
MAKSKPPAAPRPRADDRSTQWDDSEWDRRHYAAGHDRARKLLSPKSSIWHRLGDRFRSRGGHRPRGRWGKRIVTVFGGLFIVSAVCFAVLWWRLGAGPINFDMATPWLADAIQDNIGEGNTVEIGGTQIERAGRVRMAVRIRDIVVRDRDRAVIASAPKAEVKISFASVLMGRMRAESLNLVDVALAVRITPDGQVTVSTGNNERPIATGMASPRVPGAWLGPAKQPELTFPRQPQPPVVQVQPAPGATPAPREAPSGILAGLDWLDTLTLSGLDGQNLNEVGLKNGRLVVDDQQRGNKWEFNNISLSLRRPSGGGVALTVGEGGKAPWSLGVNIGAPSNGVRSVDLKADKVSTKNILLALRMKDLTYSADIPLTGELKGEIGRDGVPTYLRGKLTAGAGDIIDNDTPDYPMPIDSAEISFEWDAGRRVLLAPFKVISGANRVTLLAHVEPPNGTSNAWQAGLSGGTIVLGGRTPSEAPLIFNNISIRAKFDPDNRLVSLTQANISNGELGVAGTGSVDYASEPRMKLGFAGTPMNASALKRMWPILIVPEVREWVIERIEAGNLQRIEIGVNSPTKNLTRRGPPIPDDGLNVSIIANDVSLRPVDGLPAVHDGDLRARITGRTATVTISQANVDTPGGRKLNLSDVVFEVPDMAPKPSPSRIRFKLDGPAPGVVEVLNSDRLSEASGNMLDPNAIKGNVTAQVAMGMPIQHELTKADTTYNVTADLKDFSADKLVMNQKVEANTLKIAANNQGYQVRGDIKINGQSGQLDYRKPTEGDADVRLSATLDDASRARMGVDLGTAVVGALPLKLNGKIGSGDRDSKFNIEADLTPLKLDNLLPGWAKVAGKSAKAAFNVVKKGDSTRLEDITVDGAGATIKGSVELDQNGDLVNVNFPTYSPSEGDKTSIRAERGNDGVLKVTMRGDVFDGRGFLKGAMSGGKEPDTKSKAKTVDFDIDVKLGAVAGFYGEAVRSVDAKVSRRNGTISKFALTGKLGRDTPLTGDMRGKSQGAGRDVIFIETNDAGAFLRVTDTYSKMFGGQLALAMDTPSTDTRPKEGLINVRNFTVKGEASLERVAASGGPPGAQNSGIAFTRLRAEFVRQNGLMTVREGLVQGPSVGATIEGNIDYNANQVRMSGTFVPMYGLNNMFGQIPVVGLFLGGGSNEGLFGVTYEVVGTPGAPVLRVNPLSAIAPGITRKIFDFSTGKQNNSVEFPNQNNNSN